MSERSVLNGLAEYSAALDEVVGLARRHIRIFDYNLENLGFNSASRHDLLHGFLLANPENRLYIVLRSPDYLVRYCPRMTALLRRFSHNMAIRETLPEIAEVCDPFCLADSDNYVRRFHFEDLRGVFGREDPHEGHALAQRFDLLWQSSTPSVHSDVTGL